MILVTLAYMEGWTYVRTVYDVMAIKPKFVASMGYHNYFLNFSARRARSSAKIEPLNEKLIPEIERAPLLE